MTHQDIKKAVVATQGSLDSKQQFERLALYDIDGTPYSSSLVFDVTKWGADPYGLVSSVPALNNIYYAIKANRIRSVSGGTTWRAPIVWFPPGDYLIDTPLDWVATATATSRKDQPRISIYGANRNVSVLHFVNTATWRISNGAFSVHGLTFEGDNTNDGLLTLGPVSVTSGTTVQAVSQFDISGCEFHSAISHLKVAYAFDGSVRDCIFRRSFGTGYSVDFLNNGQDNANNIVFERCHLEYCDTTGGLLQILGGSGSTLRHGRMAFIGCHLETNPNMGRPINMEYVHSIDFIGCQIVQNGSTPAVDAPDVVRLVNASNIDFGSSSVGRSVAGDYVSNLFAIGGNSGRIVLPGKMALGYTTNGERGLNYVWRSDPTVPNTASWKPVISPSSMVMDNTTQVPMSDSEIYFTNPDDRSQRQRLAINPATGGLVASYSDSITSVSDTEQLGVEFLADGGFRNSKGMYKGRSIALADGATFTTGVTNISDSRRRGRWEFVVSGTVDEHASFIKGLTSGVDHLKALTDVGSLVVVTDSQTDPAPAGKWSIYLASGGQQICVTNRTGALKTFSLHPFGV